MAVKYQILYKDRRDNDCSVLIDFADYAGTEVIALTGADQPFTITYDPDTDSDDLFTPIISSKANLQVLINQNSQQFVSDVRDIDDKAAFVIAYYGNGKKWIGYLIADQNYERFDVTGYFMSLTAVDPFSYLKSDDKTVLSTTTMFGLQTVYDFISAVISEAITNVPIEIINNYTPSIKDCYFLTDTLMQDGVYPSGYDMISTLMTSFAMTAVISNGILYVINRRSCLTITPKSVGLHSDEAENYLLGNSENITRTRGAKSVSVNYEYGNKGNALNNGYFYFYDPSKTLGTEITDWIYPTGSDNRYTGCSVQRIGNGQDSNKYGVKISGINTVALDVNYLWLYAKTFLISDQNTLYYRLTVKYKYDVYKNYNSNGDTYPIYYGLNLLFTDAAGLTYTYRYIGDSQLNPKNDGSTGSWDTYATPGAGIKFPLSNKGGEGTFDLCILRSQPNFDSGSDPKQFTIELLPLNSAGNDDYNTNIGSANMPTDITIESVEFFSDIRTISEESAPVGQYGNLYENDTTDITDNKKYSLIEDQVTVKVGLKNIFRTYPNGREIPFSLIDGSLMNQDETPIETFTNGTITDKLVTIVAKDRIFFARQPRYKVDLEIRSDDIDMTDILSFEDLLPNGYVILSNEIDTRNCKHHITAQELRGTDDINDDIQNYLS